MTRYLISFPSDAMAHIPDEEGPEVARAAHAVIDEAKEAGVYLFTGGLDEDVEPVMVAGDGTVTAGTYPPSIASTMIDLNHEQPQAPRSARTSPDPDKVGP